MNNETTWIRQITKAARSGDVLEIEVLPPAPPYFRIVPNHLVLDLTELGRPDIVMAMHRRGAGFGGTLHHIFVHAIDNPEWRAVHDAILETEVPQVSGYIAPDAPYFRKDPAWIAAVLRRLVRLHPSEIDKELDRSTHANDLSRMILIIAAGHVPQDYLMETSEFHTREILEMGRSGHARLALLCQIGSLEALLEKPVGAHVAQLWPNYPIFSHDCRAPGDRKPEPVCKDALQNNSLQGPPPDSRDKTTVGHAT